MHDSINAKEATCKALLVQDAIYTDRERCLLAFFLSALICPLAFGGSFIDSWPAGLGAVILCWVQLRVSSQNVVTANVVEQVLSPRHFFRQLLTLDARIAIAILMVLLTYIVVHRLSLSLPVQDKAPLIYCGQQRSCTTSGAPRMLRENSTSSSRNTQCTPS